MEKRTSIPISLVKQMLFKHARYLRDMDEEDIEETYTEDPGAPAEAMLFMITAYEEGKQWDYYEEDENGKLF